MRRARRGPSGPSYRDGRPPGQEDPRRGRHGEDYPPDRQTARPPRGNRPPGQEDPRRGRYSEDYPPDRQTARPPGSSRPPGQEDPWFGRHGKDYPPDRQTARSPRGNRPPGQEDPRRGRHAGTGPGPGSWGASTWPDEAQPWAAESRQDPQAAKHRRTDLLWLAGIAAAFTAALIVFTPLHQGFSWDESVYVSQISQHTPMMPWAAERARGMPLLVAPVTLETGSPTILRLYLALLAGLGLFLALLAWRGLRSAKLLALAGLIFGGLWIAQAEAPLVFPNFWAAIGGVSGTGLFLKGVTRTAPLRYVAVLLTAATAFTALMRPADAVFLFGPLIVAALAVKEWRSLPVSLALISGLVLGLGEWLVEAYIYFGGLSGRLRGTSAASGGTGLHLISGFRVMNGRINWSYPGTLAWWAVFLLLAAFGIWAVSRSRGWPFALVPVAGGVSLYVLYSFPNLVSARYLLPTWFLLAIVVADGIAWICVSAHGSLRPAGLSAAAIFVLAGLVSQHIVLARQISTREAAVRANDEVVRELYDLNVRPPCIITSDSTQHFMPVSMPAAYGLRCSYIWDLWKIYLPNRRQIVMIESGVGHAFRYARDWPHRAIRTSDGIVQVWIEPSGLLRNGKVTPKAHRKTGHH